MTLAISPRWNDSVGIDLGEANNPWHSAYITNLFIDNMEYDGLANDIKAAMPSASETVKGMAFFASEEEVIAGNDETKMISPGTLHSLLSGPIHIGNDEPTAFDPFYQEGLVWINPDEDPASYAETLDGGNASGFADIIKFAGDTIANWNTADPVVPERTMVLYDNGGTGWKAKIGFNNKAFSELDEFGTGENLGVPDVSGYLLSSTSSGIRSWVKDVLSTVLTGLSTATNAAIAATDTILAAFGKLAARVNAIWDETDIDRIYVPVGATGVSYRVGRNCTFNYCYIDCLDLAGAADAPTSLTVSVAKGGTNQFTTSAITTAASTYDNTDFNADAGDLITVTVSNTTGVAGGVMVGLRGVRR